MSNDKKRKYVKLSGIDTIYNSKEEAISSIFNSINEDLSKYTSITDYIENGSYKDGETMSIRYYESDGKVNVVSLVFTLREGMKPDLSEVPRTRIIDSPTPPNDKDAIWIDSSHEEDENYNPIQDDVRSLKKAFAELLKVVNRHEYAFTHSMNSGDIYNSAKGDMMAMATPELTYYDTENVVLEGVVSGETSGITASGFNLYIQGTNLSDYTETPMTTYIKQPYWIRVVTEPKNAHYLSIDLSVSNTEGCDTKLVKKGDSVGLEATVSGSTSLTAKMTPEIGAEPIVKTYRFSFLTNKEPDYPSNREPNVKHLIIKSVATYKELADNIGYLCMNELIWCEGNSGLYMLGKTSGGDIRLFKLNGGGGTGPDIPVDPDFPDNPNIQDMISGITQNGDSIGSIRFVSTNGTKYNVGVSDDGELRVDLEGGIASEGDSYGTISTDDNGVKTQDYVFYQNKNLTEGGLFINSVYCGGIDGENGNVKYDSHTLDNYCSHNFVELSNTTRNDLDLNGLSLQYATVNKNWKVLPLKGKIKAGSTFLIRGSQCALMDTNTTVIKVKDYDMEWVDNDGKAHDKKIQFSLLGAKFYLCYGTEPCTVSDPYYLSDGVFKLQYGYIDLIGLDNGSYWEITGNEGACEGGAAPSNSYRVLSKERLYTKYYNLDPVKQANKAYNARTNNGMWYYVDLSKKDGEIIPSVKAYTPVSSKGKKNFYFNKSLLLDTKPTVITCSFGIKAVSDDNANGAIVDFRNRKSGQKSYAGATRCFNWTSKNYYDEYLWVRVKGTNTWGTAYESIKAGETVSIASGLTVGVYDRIRQEYSDGAVLTAHKQILYNIKPGTYEYVAGHKNADGTPDLEKCTDIKSFTVLPMSAVTSADGFTFVQTSDQQGFNWDEYQVWKIAGGLASSNKSTVNGQAPSFMINTGDMTQNGNRINEWLDYFSGKSSGLDNMPEMATIGNNDLSPKNLSALGFGADADKINPANITFYYTFELDEENAPIFNVNVGDYVYADLYVPSLYSFNYGKAHFMCVNSEISYSTEKNIFGIEEATSNNTGFIYEKVKEWCDKDIKNNGGDMWNIAFCHEMPFTIITRDLMLTWYDFNALQPTFRGTAVRGGSRINTMNKPENAYWFSEFCQENNIRLVIGGHKHTQSTSWPLKENITIVDGVRTVNTMQPIIQVTKEDLTNYFGSTGLTHFVVYEDKTKGVKVEGDYPSSWFENGSLKISNVGEKAPYKYVPSRDAYFCTFELVDKITAPVYAMSQATGYKHTSNKELPCHDCMPWNRYYFPATSDNKANTQQKSPFFTTWTIKDDGIYGEVKRVDNLMDGGKFEVNKYHKDGKTPVVNNGLFPNVSMEDDTLKIVIK